MLVVESLESVSRCSRCVKVGVSPRPPAWCPATPGATSPSSVCPRLTSAGYSGVWAVVTSLTSAGEGMSAFRNLFLATVSLSLYVYNKNMRKTNNLVKTTISQSLFLQVSF